MAIVWRNTFTASDDTNVTGITPEVGSAIEIVSGNPSMRVTSNRARVNVGDVYSINQTPELGADANYTVRAVGRQLSSSSFAWKLWARRVFSPSSLGYEVYYEPSFLRLRANDGGGWTDLGSITSWSGTTGNDHTVELVCNGDQISVVIDGVTRLGPYTNTASTVAGRVLLETAEYTSNVTTAGWHWDSIEVDTLSVGGPSAPPSFGRNKIFSRF